MRKERQKKNKKKDKEKKKKKHMILVNEAEGRKQAIKSKMRRKIYG